MAETAADRLVPLPSSGRRWAASRRVRFGDVDPAGRVRLDALACYIQDLASDDTDDAGLGGDMVWVVRRAVIEVRVTPRFLEDLDLVTWCGGLGRRWAERRVSMTSARGAAVEAALLWVSLDRASGRPLPLSPPFLDLFGEAAGGREVSARLQHPSSPPPDATLTRKPWPLRATDFDLLDHVNNAATWAMVEEVLADHPRKAPYRAEIEYRLPIERGCDVELDVASDDDGSQLWATGRTADCAPDQEPVVFTTARVVSLPG
jgi:acyl-ACP thioesterase